MFLLFQCGIFRFYVRFQGCSSWLEPPTKKYQKVMLHHMCQAKQWAKKGSKSKLILAETSSLWKMFGWDLYPTEESSILFGTRKKPFQGWLAIGTHRYPSIRTHHDGSNPNTRLTFKHQVFFFTKNLHSQGRSHVFSNGGVVFLSVKITMWGTFVSLQAIRQHFHRWGLLKPWNKLKFDS